MFIPDTRDDRFKVGDRILTGFKSLRTGERGTGTVLVVRPSKETEGMEIIVEEIIEGKSGFFAYPMGAIYLSLDAEHAFYTELSKLT